MKRLAYILFCLFFNLVQAFPNAEEPHKVISQMLEQLGKHHSFSYDEEIASWLPGENERDGKVGKKHTLEVVDADEPYVGARFVRTSDDGGFFAYDGKKRLRNTEEPLVFEVDSVFKGITEYRVVPRPFYQVAKAIGQYILSTTDSVQVEMQETRTKVKNKLNKGDTAPDFELQDTEGKLHKLSQYRGQTVLVEFTSVACSVCQIVPVFLHQLSQEFPQLQILSIEAWNMKPSACVNWIKRKGITHPYLLDGKDTQPLYTDNAAVPAFFIIDAEGKLVAEFTGYSEKTTPSAISEILRGLGE